MDFVRCKKILLEGLVTRAIQKVCYSNRHHTGLPFDILVGFSDDMGKSRWLSVRITPVERYPGTNAMSIASLDVTASCKYPDPDWPADELQLEFMYNYLPDSDDLKLIDANFNIVADRPAVPPSHQWEAYVGFTESYNHCRRCGVKEGSKDECK